MPIRVRTSDPRKVRRYNVSAREHEGAAVVSGERALAFDAPVSAHDMESRCIHALEALKSCVLERDGVIGHIKAFCASGTESVALSTTGDSIQARPTDGWSACVSGAYIVSIAAIAYVSLSSFESALIEGLEGLDSFFFSKKGQFVLKERMHNMELNGYIDHTLLKPDATAEQVRKLCREAKEHSFASVCVNPSRIALAAKELEGSAVLPCCVVGFPLGATLSTAKAAEASAVVALGAKEVDMVINIGAAKEGDWALVQRDIEAVVEAAGGKAHVKVIIETCLLTDDEKRRACEAAKAAGADFVKTSTGFSSGGATAADVALMRSVVGSEMGVKASGGVKTRADALAMIKAGATRLGTSSGLAIVE